MGKKKNPEARAEKGKQREDKNVQRMWEGVYP